MRLRLDLRESLQRDFLFGLYDRFELDLVRRELSRGGDFVDVGAHIGMYTVAAALALRAPSRVLAFEPNPLAREQLLANLELNACADLVVVKPEAVAAAPGRAVLHVPATPDPSFSSLEAGRFAEGAAVEVATTTLDHAVTEHALRPAVVKADVEGAEVEVVRGMERTVAEARPLLVVEANAESAEEIRRLLPGYEALRVERGRLVPLAGGRGLFNAVFRATRR